MAAQALVAAGSTIEQTDRHVHSSTATSCDPGVLAAHRVSGGAATRRPVVLHEAGAGRPARRDDLHHVRELRRARIGSSHQVPMPAAPPPETLPQAQTPTASVNPELRQMGFPEERQLDLRLIDRETAEELTGSAASMIAWFRTSKPLPDDPLLQVCALTCFSGHHVGGQARNLGPDARERWQWPPGPCDVVP